ncbi:hypothetical protein PHYPO_G00175070 [Pangasianodon hypophthalmus]|uniref:Uncharacterized protein n=1 Tax=Pangasianodon hypophthalmus TaxID=310915 RepID=A0A5N5PQL1_PANHP|nr:hypothetical protein PHYPO_G00175070 [Pangasianodon hypophthalmus]
MSATFYILTVLGALLVPTFAKEGPGKAPTLNITTTLGAVLQNQETDNTTGSMNVSSETVDDGTTTTENSTINISNTPTPPEEGNTPRDKPFETTTKKKKDMLTPGPTANPTTKKKSTTTKSTTASTDSHTQPSRSVYIVVLLVVILSVAVIGIIFFCVKSNRRRFSVDIHAKNEDAEIPLASVEPEMCDSSPKDMKTFTAVEGSSPTDTVEKTEEGKADQQVKERSAESQTTEAPVEKLAGPTFLDVNDGDPTASTKTSVETLNDVLNENNSNNNAVHDFSFIEICLKD